MTRACYSLLIVSLVGQPAFAQQSFFISSKPVPPTEAPQRQLEGAPTERFTSFHVSRDGSQLLGVTPNGKLWHYDVTTEREITLGELIEADITAAAFSPNGAWRAAGTSTGQVYLDSLTPPAERHILNLERESIQQLAFSLDGAQVLAVDQSGSLGVWSCKDQTLCHKSKLGELKTVRAATLLADGQHAVIAGDESLVTINLADGTQTGRKRHPPKGTVVLLPRGGQASIHHLPKISALHFSGDGPGYDAYANELKPLTTLAAHPDSEHVALASSDGRMELIQLHRKEVHWRADLISGGYDNVAISDDGRTLAAKSRERILLYRLPDSFPDLRLPKDGVPLLTAKHRLLQRGVGHTGYFFPGATLQCITTGHAKAVRLWDVESGKLLKETSENQMGGPFGGMAISPDGARLLLVRVVNNYREKALRLWDMTEGREIRQFGVHEHLVSALAISPDGKLALSGSYDETTRLWDLETGKQLKMWGTVKSMRDRVKNDPNPIQFHPVSRVAFSRTGKYAAECSQRGVKVWTTADWEPVPVKIEPDPYFEFRAMEFTSDETQLIVANQHEIQFHSLDPDHQAVRVLNVVDPPVMNFAMSPDQTRIACGTGNGLVHLYNLKEKRMEARISGHNGYITNVAFSPDGRYLLSCAHELLLTELPAGKTEE